MNSKNQRARNLALLIIFLGLVFMLYIVGFIRVGGHSF